MDCGCEFSVNLRIFHGQFGTEISENDEESKGALTVANKNGDNGGNEVDLMKLIIDKEGRAGGECEVKIEKTGNITFWENSNRTSQITNLMFSSDDLPKEVWVEAVDVSAVVKDIEIRALIGNNVQDIVKATGLWCEFVDKYNSGNTPDPMDTDLPLSDFIVDFVDANNNYYGLGYYDSGYGGRILVEFELFPKDVETLWSIHFDVTRRKSTERQTMISGANQFVTIQGSNFPNNPEFANDDEITRDDEDNTPDVFYGYDGPNIKINPNLPTGQNSFAYDKYNGNFEEFVRMSFEPFPYIGTGVQGSRCSYKVPWVHNRCVKIWSDDPNDPYSPPNQRYKVIESVASHSMPTRNMGAGTGIIVIELLANAETEGYAIIFDDNNIANLYNSAILVDTKVKSNGGWVLMDSGKINVIVQDNPSLPYNSMDDIRFSVLNSSTIFNNIKVE